MVIHGKEKIMSNRDFEKSMRFSQHSDPIRQMLAKIAADRMILARLLKQRHSAFKNCRIKEIANTYILGAESVGCKKAAHTLKTDILLDAKTNFAPGTAPFDLCIYVQLPGTHDITAVFVTIDIMQDFFPSKTHIQNAGYGLTEFFGINPERMDQFLDSQGNVIDHITHFWICLHPPKECSGKFLDGFQLCTFTELPEKIVQTSVIGLSAACKASTEENRMLSLLFSTKYSAREKENTLAAGFDILPGEDARKALVWIDENQECIEHPDKSAQILRYLHFEAHSGYTLRRVFEEFQIPKSEYDQYLDRLAAI